MKHAKVRTIALDYLGTQTYKSSNFLEDFKVTIQLIQYSTHCLGMEMTSSKLKFYNYVYKNTF